MKSENYVEEQWNDFWKDIVCNPDGSVNMEQIKKELSDFRYLMKQVPKVYCEVTGNTLSKIMYPAEKVIECFNDYTERLLKDQVQDIVDDMISDEVITKEIGEIIKTEMPKYV